MMMFVRFEREEGIYSLSFSFGLFSERCGLLKILKRKTCNSNRRRFYSFFPKTENSLIKMKPLVQAI